MSEDYNREQHNILKGYNMLLYFAGTMIMYEPSEECIVDFWKRGILKTLPVSSANPVFIRAAAQLRESCTDESSSISEMTKDYKRLFSSEDLSTAPVYESQYLNRVPANGEERLIEVSEFYNSYGWESKSRPRMKDDHLGIELLFLTTMVEKYILLDDEACRREMRSEIRRFIEQHILTWISEWYRRVQENSITLSYKGISSLIYACIQDIHSLLSGRNDIIYNPATLKN
jgi:putative dimethyl sulfoxide reductase chaperone